MMVTPLKEIDKKNQTCLNQRCTFFSMFSLHFTQCFFFARLVGLFDYRQTKITISTLIFSNIFFVPFFHFCSFDILQVKKKISFILFSFHVQITLNIRRIWKKKLKHSLSRWIIIRCAPHVNLYSLYTSSYVIVYVCVCLFLFNLNRTQQDWVDLNELNRINFVCFLFFFFFWNDLENYSMVALRKRCCWCN